MYYDESGYAELNYRGHATAGWFSVNAMESSAKFSRQVFLTLNRDQQAEFALALLKTLGVGDGLRARVAQEVHS